MKTTNSLSLLSVIITGFFLLLAIGSGLVPAAIDYLDDGRVRETRVALSQEGGTATIVKVGTRDLFGRWHGIVTTTRDGHLNAEENYEHGVRVGRQEYFYRGGDILVVHYDSNGKRISSPNQAGRSDSPDSDAESSLYVGNSGFRSDSKYSRNTFEIPSIEREGYNGLRIYKETTVTDIISRLSQLQRTYPPKASGGTDRKFSAHAAPAYNDGSMLRIQTVPPSFEYLEYESPWFVILMDHLGYEETHVQAFLADIEAQISETALADNAEFTSAFYSVVDTISEAHAIGEAYEFVLLVEASRALQSFDLRLAVIDRQLNPGKSTLEILEENYPEFLAILNESADMDSIQAFTDDLDLRMDAEGPLDVEEHMLPDTIDQRFSSALTEIDTEGVHNSVAEILTLIGTEMAVQADPVHEAVRAAYFTVSVERDPDDESEIPRSTSLEQNYPNPFNPSTKIRYSIHEQSQTRLQIFDVAGKEVATLVNEEKHPGTYEVTFDASYLPSGVYMYRLQAGVQVVSKKLLLLK